MDRTNWWERRWFFAFLIAASTVPLLWPETPPLVDVPGHMGRFRVQLDLANSPDLQRYFEFHWMLVGNLGTDLLVEALGPIFGLELAVKLIVISIPPLTVLGLIWVAKEIHGRVPPTLMFAVPFVYCYPFNFGFLNFSLALALALIAFGFWLHLTNAGRLRLRELLFVPISCLLWVTHAFGWGILGLLAYSAELFRHHDQGGNWKRAIVRAALNVAPMGLPLILMAVGSGGVVGGKTENFFQLTGKAYALLAMLRDRWLIWDSFGVGAALVLLIAVYREPKLEMSRRLGIPAAILAVAFLLMPGVILGLSYADMRLAPVMTMLALLAIRIEPGGDRQERWLALLGFAFLCLRLAGNTVSFAMADRDMRQWLTALRQVPTGAPVLSLVGEYCDGRWAMPRHNHVGSFVIVRNHGFSNDQWQAAGAQLLRIRYRVAGYFDDDRSSILYSDECVRRTEEGLGKRMAYDHRVGTALALFPRRYFNYVWMFDPPDFNLGPRPGLTPVWRRDRSVLYRVEHLPN